MNSLGGYPWDVLPVSFYMDHQIPSLLPKAFCDRMAAEWKWPKFTMRTPTDCMRELEARFGDNLPTFTGDLSNQWSDAMTASPVGVARKRRAARWLPAAETLNAGALAALAGTKLADVDTAAIDGVTGATVTSDAVKTAIGMLKVQAGGTTRYADRNGVLR